MQSWKGVIISTPSFLKLLQQYRLVHLYYVLELSRFDFRFLIFRWEPFWDTSCQPFCFSNLISCLLRIYYPPFYKILYYVLTRMSIAFFKKNKKRSKLDWFLVYFFLLCNNYLTKHRIDSVPSQWFNVPILYWRQNLWNDNGEWNVICIRLVVWFFKFNSIIFLVI